MAKNKNWLDAECALKKTHKPNHGMKEKKHHSNLQKLPRFNNKKAEKQQAKDMTGGFGKDGNAPIAKPPSK